MSVLEKLVAAVAPLDSGASLSDARAGAHALATPGDWLWMALDSHRRIEQAFAAVAAAETAEAQRAAQKRLRVVLTGHAVAEEMVLYPALARGGATAHANIGYDEQILVKIQMADLERLTPMTGRYRDKLGQIERAVRHHILQEESVRFVDLKAAFSPADEAMMTKRYREEIERFIGG